MRNTTTQLGQLLMRHLPLVLALAVAAAAVAPALAVHGIVATRAGGDSPFLLQRVHQISVALAAGHIPPRWMPDAAYGLGYPFWNFYAPLAYLAAGLLAVLTGSVVGSIKVATLVAFLMAAAGAYRLGRETWSSSGSGLLAAVAYTVAPYHLVNVYVRGDALAELAAYAVYPWLLVALDRARERRTAGAVAGLALAFAALLVSHNIGALLFLPVVVAYCVWRMAPNPDWSALWRRMAPLPTPLDRSDGPAGAGGRAEDTADWRRVPQGVPVSQLVTVRGPLSAPAAWTLRCLLALERRLWPLQRVWPGRGAVAVGVGLALGTLLAAWFWAPAMLERDAVQLEQNLTGFFNYAGHFRGLDLVDLSLPFDYSMGEGGCTPCRTGLVQLLVAALGVSAGLRVAGKRGALTFWLLVALVSTFMITPLSRLLWDGLPLLEYAQFPWRWLSVQALALSLLSAPLGRLGLSGLLSLLASAALALSGLSSLPVETLHVGKVTTSDIAAFEVFSGNIGSTVRSEYLPRAVVPRPMSGVEVIYGRPGTPRTVGGFMDGATLIRRRADVQEWQIDVADDVTTTVAFPTLWFPGWEATIGSDAPDLGDVDEDGRDFGRVLRWLTTSEGEPPVETWALEGSGWLALDMPPGRHEVVLSLGRSDVRAIAEGVSLVALLLAMGLLAADRRRRWTVLVARSVLVVAGAALLARTLPVAEAEGPVTLDFGRTPYPHYNPGGIEYGGARLVGAGVTTAVVKAGESVFVNLTWENPWAGNQVEVALVSPAEPMPLTVPAEPEPLDVPDVRSRAEQNQGDSEKLVLSIPEDSHSGLYFVRLRVSDEGTEVPPRSAEGHDLGTVYLGPVRVRGKGVFREVPDSPVARMGDIRLHAVQPVQDGDKLEVRLFWETDRPLTVNYKTSVRLLDADEHVIAQDDKEPLYGFYPTTAWEPGEQILDRRWLPIPEGTAPGESYMIEVVMYEEDSGEVLDTGWVSGVKIER